MSKYYLLSSVQLGSTYLWPGTLVDDAVDNVAGIQAAAGTGVTWPSSDATVAAAAAAAQSAKANGRTPEECAAMMLSAAQASVSATATAAQSAAAASATSAAAAAPVKRTVTIDYGASADNFAALAGGVKTFSKNVGAVLPANARIVGHSVGEGTFNAFDDATHGTYTLDVGGAGATDCVSGLNVAAGQTGFPKPGTSGALGYPMAPQGGQQLVAKITSSVDLNTVTAGKVEIDVWYVVAA